MNIDESRKTLKANIKKRREERKVKKKNSTIPPPRYEDVYFDGVAWLDGIK